jgi:predicted HTH transcriptional regulator
MINKAIKAIGKEDIQALVENAVSESRTLEYKEQLPGKTDSDKYEFLKDVSSFANASGGDILYGIREKREHGKPTGIPEAIEGLNINADAEILRLENILRDGLAPRLSNVQIVPFTGFKNGPVILIRVGKSGLSPHMIAKRESRFFSRNNAGTYSLDVVEIRSAFALSESLPDKIRRFRDDRVAKIIADETPVKLSASSRVVLHVLPIAALDPGTQIDTGLLTGRIEPGLNCRINDYRHNFDGYLMFHHSPIEVLSEGYVQVFRNGAIEAVDSSIIRPNIDDKLISGNYLEGKVSTALDNYLKLEEELELQPPLFVMLTLLGVSGCKMYTGGINDETPIDRDSLFLPDIIVEAYGSRAVNLLQPAFDALWQACGFERSLSYDKAGNWRKAT